jgi:hypothetical protein
VSVVWGIAEREQREAIERAHPHASGGAHAELCRATAAFYHSARP